MPVEDAEDHIRSIVSTVRAHGAEVFLMSEARSPDPTLLVEFNDMPASVAAETDGVTCFDTSGGAAGRPWMTLSPR